MESGSEHRRRMVLVAVLLTLVLGAAIESQAIRAYGGNAQMRPTGTSAETDLQAASQWWREMPNKWTPIGWKDHVLRFNVLFDGTILVVPRRHQDRLGNHSGVQLTFAPEKGWLAPGADDGKVNQGWTDNTAPVLWSEWASRGLLLRQEVFAHVPGAKDVATGLEPLFAWVRLSVCGACQGLPVPGSATFFVKINRPFVGHKMPKRYNINYAPEKSLYPGKLSADPGDYDPAKGWRLVEDDRLVRLGLAPGAECSVNFVTGQPTERDQLLQVTVPARKGAFVDLLIPAMPVEPAVYEQELTLGHDRALAEANNYWSALPPTAARFQVPEDYVNQAIERHLQFAEIIAEKDPGSGSYSELTGSWCYSQGIWATPNAMTMIMTQAIMGRHSAVEKYLQIFKKEQGSVKPPGDAYKLHPGYLCTPKTLSTVDWLTDNGALLWAISEHVLLSNDDSVAQEWLPVILKACDFIKDSRRIENHGGVQGLLPAAQATDRKTKIQAVWSDGWNFKGLSTASRLLSRMKHPRAPEFAAEVRDYREAFQKAMRERARTMPTWVDGTGKTQHLVPTCFSGNADAETLHPFYLDGGPLFAVFAGLMDADDELMQSTLAWFREGPPREVFRLESDAFQVPCLDRELSSCEPCYSWNVFHSWQRGDREKFLEGMYSLFAGGMSRQTYSVCETRGGISGITPCLPCIYMARLAVIDDQISGNELHLLRLIPLAWLRTDKEAIFENMPTEYGPVNLRAKLAHGGKQLEVVFSNRSRNAPKRVVLHVPPVKGLKSIALNGKPVKWDGKARSLVIE